MYMFLWGGWWSEGQRMGLLVVDFVGKSVCDDREMLVSSPLQVPMRGVRLTNCVLYVV